MGRRKRHKPGHCRVKAEFRTEAGELAYTVRCKGEFGHPGTVHLGARPDGQGIVWDTARARSTGEALESHSEEAASA